MWIDLSIINILLTLFHQPISFLSNDVAVKDKFLDRMNQKD